MRVNIEQKLDSMRRGGPVSEAMHARVSGQSRAMSLVEAVANVVIGYGVAVVTQILIFPVFGLHTTLAQNLKLGALFTIVSIARSFALRRVFEAIRVASRSGGHAGHGAPERSHFE